VFHAVVVDHLASHAQRDPFHVVPSRGEEYGDEHRLYASYGHSLSHDAFGGVHDSAGGPVFVVCEVQLLGVIVLQIRDERLGRV
jgi:hypothetical protein